jgi:BirA family transcriptional regulator, biotin operon repressor / biotin---[acetyl-CoA-carboxylase] ligase
MTPSSRLPLSADRIELLITLSSNSWPGPELLDEVDSTNRVLAERSDNREGTTIVAEIQTAGRGRLGRTWESPWGSGVWMSVLVRPGDRPRADWAWLPLIAALAARDALDSACGLPCGLKWPNDLLSDGDALRKLGGILVEVVGPDAVIVGIGVNMSLLADELPTSAATSVLLEGGNPDREAFVVALQGALERRLAGWRAGNSPLSDYRAACVTIGRQVTVMLPDGSRLEGLAEGLTEDGHLMVSHEGATEIVAAGDVIHATI